MLENIVVCLVIQSKLECLTMPNYPFTVIVIINGLQYLTIMLKFSFVC